MENGVSHKLLPRSEWFYPVMSEPVKLYFQGFLGSDFEVWERQDVISFNILLMMFCYIRR